jgi:hypothetical protein
MAERTYVVVGNSIVRNLRMEDAQLISMPGKTLKDMRKELELPGTKLVVSGIPDIMAGRGAETVDGSRVSEYEKELDRASNYPGVILCPFYPPKSLVPPQWGIVHRLNQRICSLNAEKGEGTPALIQGLFGRSKSGRLFFRSERLRDEAHPSPELAADMSDILTRYVRQRGMGRIDLRAILDRQEARGDRERAVGERNEAGERAEREETERQKKGTLMWQPKNSRS